MRVSNVIEQNTIISTAEEGFRLSEAVILAIGILVLSLGMFPVVREVGSSESPC